MVECWPRANLYFANILMRPKKMEEKTDKMMEANSPSNPIIINFDGVMTLRTQIENPLTATHRSEQRNMSPVIVRLGILPKIRMQKRKSSNAPRLPSLYGTITLNRPRISQRNPVRCICPNISDVICPSWWFLEWQMGAQVDS